MHRNVPRSIIIIAVLILLSSTSKSQLVLNNTSVQFDEARHSPLEYALVAKDNVSENNEWTNKNVLNLSVGYLPNGKVNYDRYLFNLKKNTIWLSAGAGVHLIFYPFYSTASLKLMTGRMNNHFELDLGGTAMLLFTYYEDDGDETDFWGTRYLPHINIGYRYQKPDGKIVIRTGLGFPEFAYLGFGLAFED
jgi:hypothetical protein